MTYRIAYARINQETNAFSPVATELDDFKATHYLEGEELSAAVEPGGFEVQGMFRRAELAGFMDAARARRADVEPLPLLSAWAVPSGPLTRPTFEALLERLTARLRAAGRVDAVYLSLHGAMGVTGVRDPEKEILSAARSVVGNIPVAATYDLHTNETKERIEASDASQSYQTNPHRDHVKVGRRAGEILIGMLEGRVRPAVAWRSLPMVLGGGLTIDFLPPMLDLFLRMKWMERDRGVLGASVNMCHPWNTHPSLGWSASVVTNGDAKLADRLADELAEVAWEKRLKQPPRFATVSEAIAKARSATVARKLGAVMMADLSDVVTAGAPGENTAILKALLEEGQGMLSYVPLRDPVAVAELWDRPIGGEVEIAVGGRLDPKRGSPLTVRGKIQFVGRFKGFERMVVLACGDVRLVLVEGPAIVMQPQFYEQVGLSVWKADLIVVKNYFPFLLFFAKVNRKVLMVQTSGVTDFDVARELSFDAPVHPFHAVEDWRATDLRRRGLAA